MSYHEENGQVVLTMSREDYELILMALGGVTARALLPGGTRHRPTVLNLLNRLNEGNPHFTPYEISSFPESGTPNALPG